MTLKVVIVVIVGSAAALYALVCAGMFFGQSRFLFHPTPPVGPPSAYGLADFRTVSMTTRDGITLTGWLHQAPTAEKAIIYFYGNADSLANYGAFFRRFATDGYSVLGVNYRGYGGSAGIPSEQGFYSDADAALAFMAERVPVERITLIGRSIGSGVAVDLASRNRVAALALVSPFTSVVNRAAELYPLLPARLLARYRFDSIAKIGKVSAPLLIVHGDHDELIPLAHAETLYAAANEPKKIVVLAGADHIVMDLNRIADLVIAMGAGR